MIHFIRINIIILFCRERVPPVRSRLPGIIIFSTQFSQVGKGDGEVGLNMLMGTLDPDSAKEIQSPIFQGNLLPPLARAPQRSPKAYLH